ncbi:conserved hypothetical protein [Parafrankia sp. EAN1pec]|uniref:hypothetical protein n=1 Tax=Parafrankia sp. (strain EAN1pec) TaxID=298653 RepID=UPI0000541EA4|nr:conserved hypothetical protein [Frankia sp. EAN1pec]
MTGVLLLFAHLVLTVGSLGVLVLCALRLWGKVRATKNAAMDLKDHAAELATKAAELAGRLESTEVSSRLASRAS